MPRKKKPAIYLSNWSSHRTKGHHGPGRKFSIMVRTSRFAKPDGKVPVLVPLSKDLWELKGETITVDEYRERYFKHVLQKKDELAPGKLLWNPFNFFKEKDRKPVEDGDTLCCVCSREQAARGECHRVWVAVMLQEAGWKVILDGKEIPPPRPDSG